MQRDLCLLCSGPGCTDPSGVLLDSRDCSLIYQTIRNTTICKLFWLSQLGRRVVRLERRICWNGLRPEGEGTEWGRHWVLDLERVPDFNLNNSILFFSTHLYIFKMKNFLMIMWVTTKKLDLIGCNVLNDFLFRKWWTNLKKDHVLTSKKLETKDRTIS